MRAWLLAAVWLSSALGGAAFAQTYTYSVYLNIDSANFTGCEVQGSDGQRMTGVDYELSAVVSGSPPMVTQRRLAACSNGSFGTPVAIGSGYPVGLNNGTALGGGGFADVIELSVERQQLPGAFPNLSVGFGASSDTLDDAVFTRDGTATGAPLGIGFVRFIPTAGIGVLLLMGGLLAFLAWRSIKRNGPMTRVLIVSTLLAFSAAAWAMNYVLDGDVGDWSGQPPLATDAAGDSPLAGSDIVAAFGVDNDPTLWFRIDVVDAENRPPVAVDDAYTVLEDQPLTVAAPGVLANDSDPDGDPITAQLETGATSGTLQLNADGGFAYTPVANENGTASFTYTAFDGQVSSAPATATISITPVNDVPSFTAGANQTVLEDAGAQAVTGWATAIDDGDPELAQALSFNITANTNAALFSAGPSVAADGTLSFTPAADANGSATITLNLMDDGGTANGGVDTSADQSFVINVTAVNDAPSFTTGPNQTVLEDAAAQTVAGWATAISAGPADESGQVLTFSAPFTATGNLSFSVPPAVAADGTLTYTLAPNTNGVATISLSLMDDGGTANGGVDTSPVQTVTITVTGVNDEPSFTVGANQTVLEDAGAQTVSGWATAIDDGDPEVVQGLTFNIAGNSNAALFSAGPSVAADGTLSYTPAANANGSAALLLHIMDDGGTANGGVDSSPNQIFTISVTAVNDAPSFVAGANQVIDEDSAAQSIAGWATSISPGPADEAGQTVSFSANITGTVGSLSFTTPPTVSSTGTLTYAIDPDTSGSATVSVILMDNGGTANGGIDASAAQVLTITVNPINDAPVNTVPGQQIVAGASLTFSTGNSNAISVLDIDADPGTIQVDLSVTAGTLEAVATPGVTISNNISAAVTLAGLQADINSAMDGLVYVPAGPGTDTLTVLTNDLGNTGAPGALADSDTVTILVDAPPTVTVTPANGATSGSGPTVSFTFSELVDLQAGAATIACVPSGAGTTSGALANTGNLNFGGAPANTGQPGDTCTVTMISTLVTDTDLVDPPNELDGDNSGDSVDGDADNFVSTYSIDSAPAFVSSSPAGGATVANTATFSATFSEPVDLGMGALSLNCGGPIAVTPSGSGTATLTFTPVAPLPNGSSCTATLVAANITDSDSFDPPDNLPADVVINFSVDAAPAVVGVAPANAATQIATNTAVTFDFSEPVNGGAGAITLNCGGSIAGTLSGSSSATLTFTPSAPLPENTACTATAVATLIDDVDAFDPPANPLANVVRTFTTDAAPSVLSTVPASGALLQSPSGTITINFSESVNFDTTANAANTSFDLECPAATNFTVGTASPATSVVIDPDDLAIAGQTCTLTIRAAGITDADAGDPPDNLAADVIVTIGYDDPAIANDDSYAVTPHMLLSIDTGVQGGRVLANDTIGSGAITGFGPIGSCAAAVPNGSNFITTAGGGRVVLNLNGSFSYAPPASLVGNGTAPSPEDGFCYTLTGGDTADVGFELQNTELVWFADANYAGANGMADGTQARPHTTLPAVQAVDTTNDTIHLAFNAAPYAAGISLEVGERLIGSGSASTLAAITSITPVAGSAFPALGGSRPTINSATTAVNLAANNTVRGLNIGNAPDGLVGGVAFGTFTMSEASILGTGRAINFNAAGTVNLALDQISSSGGFNGIVMSSVGGTITVGAGGTTIGGTTGGDAIFVQSAPVGTNFNFGATTIASALSGVTSNVNDAATVLTFTSLAITTPTGPGLVSNSGTINIGGVSNTINSTGGPALSVGSTNTGAGWTFSTLSSTNSPTNGIILDNVTGGTIRGNGGSISGSSGTAFQALNGLSGGVVYIGNISKTSAGRLVDISGAGGGDVTHSGNLSCTVACGTGAGNHGLRIDGRTSGLIRFEGGTRTINSSGANPGVSLTNNTGARITIVDGGLAVTTTSGTAFEATGGGIIRVGGAGNTLSTTTGIALNLQNTTIQTGIEFQSINSDGGVSGIVLNNTGALGGLTVSGTGVAGSGGTIQNKTGDGIRLANTQDAILLNMNLTSTASGSHTGVCGNDAAGNVGCIAAINLQSVSTAVLRDIAISGGQQYGINGNGVADLELRDSSISGSGDQAEEDGIRLVNLTGTSLIRDTTVQDSFNNNLRVFNTVATALDLSVGGTSRFLRSGNDGIYFQGINSANMTLNVSNALFDSANGDHIQTAIDDAAVMNVTIASNIMTATNPAVLGSGITLSSSGDFSGSQTFNISGNTITDANAKAINVNLGTSTAAGGTGTYSGTVNNNIVGFVGDVESGGFGIDLVANGGGTLTAAVTNNSIRQFLGDHGIRVLHRDGNGRINATVTGNTVGQPEPGGFNGVVVQAGASSVLPDSATVCLDITGNFMAGSGGFSTDFRLRQRFSTTFQLRGYGGVATDTAAVVAFVQGVNPGAETGSATTEVPGSGFINTAGGAPCLQP